MGASDMTGNKEKGGIQSVERALDALELVVASGRGLKNVEIAEKLGIKPNTANNILRTLFQKGYLSQDDQRSYIPGLKCSLLAGFDTRYDKLRSAALPLMRELADKTGDLVFLGVLNGFNLVCLEQISGSGALVVSESHSWNEKTHASACGKLLLANLPTKELESYLKRGTRARFTEKTICAETALRNELELIRTRGIATSIDESAIGVSAVAVPLRDEIGRIFAALGQSFPSCFLEKGGMDISERVALLERFAVEIQNGTIRRLR